MRRVAMDAIADPVTLDALRVLAPGLFGGSAVSSTESARYLDPGRSLTLGRWSWAMTRTATVATPFRQANQSDDQLERQRYHENGAVRPAAGAPEQSRKRKSEIRVTPKAREKRGLRPACPFKPG